MKYDVTADWLINLYCNFSCSYCFQVSKNQHDKSLNGKRDYLPAIKFFNKSNLTWLIHVSGGEPFLVPGFIGLCHNLTKKHYISINTNLSFNNINKFTESIDPKRVQFVHTSLHFHQRKEKGGIGIFNNNFKLLKKSGFTSYVTQVFYPPIIGEFPQIFESFQRKNIIIHPKVFRGFYKTRYYPQDYTKEEREIFRYYSHLASEKDPISKAHIDPILDLKFLGGNLSFKGSRCMAGRNFVRIDYHGNIYRCSDSKKIIGNIFKGEFIRSKNKEFCSFATCSCPYYGLKFAMGKPHTTKRGVINTKYLRLKHYFFRTFSSLR